MRSSLLGLVFAAAPLVAQAQVDETVELGRPTRIQVRLVDDAVQLEVDGRRAERQTLPGGTVTGASVRSVTLAGGAVVAVVTVPDRAAALVANASGRPTILWTGNLALHGDPGERRRDVVQVADRTGDGVPEVIVGYVQEGRAICGEETTLLEPRAVEPRSLTLRSVSLRNLSQRTEVTVEAQPGPPEALEREAPLIQVLQPRGASSAAGASTTPLPTGLVDGDPAVGWVEAAPGPGRWEFATLRVTDPGLAVHTLALVPRAQEDVGAPRELRVQGDSGQRVVVRFPREPAVGEVWWVPLPEPVRWTCVSVVLGDAFGDPAHVGLGEVRAFTEVDLGGGMDALVARLASGGEEGARAARALRSLGPDALDPLVAGWADMTAVEKRLVLRVAAAAAADERARGLFVAAAADGDEHVRSGALELAEAADAPDLLGVLTAAEGPAARDTADRAALVLARRFPAEVGQLLAVLERPGAEERPVLRRALRTAVDRGDGAEVVAAWIPTARTGARAAAALALAGGSGDSGDSGDSESPLAQLALEGAPTATEFADRWRFAAAVAAGTPPSDATRAWLATLAESEEWMLRAAALRALGAADAGGPVARAALEDPYPRVRIAAVQVLANEPDAGDALAAVARGDRWPMVRAAAVEALAPRAAARPLVRAAVRDRHEVVRAAAIRSLAAAADWGAWDSVEERLAQTREWPVVLEAGVAFARARCREDAVDALRGVVDRAMRPNPWQPDVEIAARAVEALAAIGGEEADEVVRRADSDLSPPMIRVTAQAAEAVPSCR